MNKRYIDFVPAKRKPIRGGVSGGAGSRVSGVSGASGSVVSGGTVKRPAPRRVEKAWSDEIEDFDDEVAVNQLFVEKAPPVGVSTGLPRTRKGADLRPKFVKTEVNKRPLGVGSGVVPKKASSGASRGASGVVPRTGSEVATSKKAIGLTKTAPRGAGVSFKVAPGANRGGVAIQKTTAQGMAKLQPTRAKFLNTDKIAKRPLSNTPHAGLARSTAAVSAVASDDKKAKKTEKPTVIITKPEKESKAGLIVAIVITIILGAAAGTVAFLLLPK